MKMSEQNPGRIIIPDAVARHLLDDREAHELLESLRSLTHLDKSRASASWRVLVSVLNDYPLRLVCHRGACKHLRQVDADNLRRYSLCKIRRHGDHALTCHPVRRSKMLVGHGAAGDHVSGN